MGRGTGRGGGNGGALGPPGRAGSCRVRLMSSAGRPELGTAATTTGRPAGERVAVSESIAKSDAGGAPRPTERYSRMPTRLTSTTPPPEDDERTSAHTAA